MLGCNEQRAPLFPEKQIQREPYPCLGTRVFSSLAAPGAAQLTLHRVSPSACLLDLLNVLLEVGSRYKSLITLESPFWIFYFL